MLDPVSELYDVLRDRFEYNLETGFFTYRRNVNKVKAGTVCSYTNGEGYVLIKIMGKRYSAHRLALLYVTGSFPDDLVDHINGDRSDNRYSNLQVVDKSTNVKKRETEVRGVVKVGKKNGNQIYKAQTYVKKKRIILGYFANKTDAYNAIKAFKEGK